jgi:MFS family permease
MGAVAYGYDTGFFGGTIALDSFKNDFDTRKDPNASANLVSLFQGGSFVGAAAQLPMTMRWGRKWSIIVSNIIFIASALIQTFSNGR